MFGLVVKRKTFSRGASFSFLDSAVWTLSDQGSTPWSRDGGLEPSWKSMFLGRWWFSFSKIYMEVEVLVEKPWRFWFFVSLPPFSRVKLYRWFRFFLERHPFQNSKMCSTLGGVGRGRVEWFFGSRSAVIQPRIILPSSVNEGTQCSEASESRGEWVESGWDKRYMVMSGHVRLYCNILVIHKSWQIMSCLFYVHHKCNLW